MDNNNIFSYFNNDNLVKLELDTQLRLDNLYKVYDPVFNPQDILNKDMKLPKIETSVNPYQNHSTEDIFSDRSKLDDLLFSDDPNISAKAAEIQRNILNDQATRYNAPFAVTPYQKGQEKYTDANWINRNISDDGKYGFSSMNSLAENDDFYRRNVYDKQSMLGSAWRNTLTFAGRVGTQAILKFGEGVATLGSMAYNIGQDDYWAKVSDNYIARTLEEAEETVKAEWFPIYKSLDYDKKGFFQKLGRNEFWNDSFADGAAFLLSAMAPGAAIGKLGTLGKTAGTFGRIMGAEAEAASILGRTLQATTGARNLAGVTAHAYGVLSEAGIEASHQYKKVKEDLDSDPLYANLTEEQKVKKAGDAAAYTFKWNTAVLSLTNAMGNKFIQQLVNKAPNSVGYGINKLGQAIEEKGIVSKLLTNTKLGNFLNTNSGKRLSFWGGGALKSSIMEGYVEENLQSAITRIADTKYGKGYYDRMANNSDKSINEKSSLIANTEFGDLMKQWWKQTKDATRGEDREVAESIGIGAILGIGGGQILSKLAGGYKMVDKPVLNKDGTAVLDKEGNPVVEKVRKVQWLKGARKQSEEEVLEKITSLNKATNNFLDSTFIFNKDGSINKDNLEGVSRKVQSLVNNAVKVEGANISPATKGKIQDALFFDLINTHSEKGTLDSFKSFIKKDKESGVLGLYGFNDKLKSENIKERYLSLIDGFERINKKVENIDFSRKDMNLSTKDYDNHLYNFKNSLKKLLYDEILHNNYSTDLKTELSEQVGKESFNKTEEFFKDLQRIPTLEAFAKQDLSGAYQTQLDELNEKINNTELNEKEDEIFDTLFNLDYENKTIKEYIKKYTNSETGLSNYIEDYNKANKQEEEKTEGNTVIVQNEEGDKVQVGKKEGDKFIPETPETNPETAEKALSLKHYKIVEEDGFFNLVDIETGETIEVFPDDVYSYEDIVEKVVKKDNEKEIELEKQKKDTATILNPIIDKIVEFIKTLDLPTTDPVQFILDNTTVEFLTELNGLKEFQSYIAINEISSQEEFQSMMKTFVKKAFDKYQESITPKVENTTKVETEEDKKQDDEEVTFFPFTETSIEIEVNEETLVKEEFDSAAPYSSNLKTTTNLSGVSTGSDITTKNGKKYINITAGEHQIKMAYLISTGELRNILESNENYQLVLVNDSLDLVQIEGKSITEDYRYDTTTKGFKYGVTITIIDKNTGKPIQLPDGGIVSISIDNTGTFGKEDNIRVRAKIYSDKTKGDMSVQEIIDKIYTPAKEELKTNLEKLKANPNLQIPISINEIGKGKSITTNSSKSFPLSEIYGYDKNSQIELAIDDSVPGIIKGGFYISVYDDFTGNSVNVPVFASNIESNNFTVTDDEGNKYTVSELFERIFSRDYNNDFKQESYDFIIKFLTNSLYIKYQSEDNTIIGADNSPFTLSKNKDGKLEIKRDSTGEIVLFDKMIIKDTVQTNIKIPLLKEGDKGYNKTISVPTSAYLRNGARTLFAPGIKTNKETGEEQILVETSLTPYFTFNFINAPVEEQGPAISNQSEIDNKKKEVVKLEEERKKLEGNRVDIKVGDTFMYNFGLARDGVVTVIKDNKDGTVQTKYANGTIKTESKNNLVNYLNEPNGIYNEIGVEDNSNKSVEINNKILNLKKEIQKLEEQQKNRPSKENSNTSNVGVEEGSGGVNSKTSIKNGDKYTDVKGVERIWGQDINADRTHEIEQMLKATAEGAAMGATIQSVEDFKVGKEAIFRKPQSIEAAKNNQNYNVEIQSDGSAKVIGVLDPRNNEWVGIPKSNVSENKSTNIVDTPSVDIINELNKLSTIEEKLNWLKENNLIVPIEINGRLYNSIDYDERVMVLAKFGKYNIPFYISTGQAGKKNVKAGNWYAVFGIGESGWINKGTEEYINKQYDFPVFQKIAKILNEGLGTYESGRANGKLDSNIGDLQIKDINSFNAQMNLSITPAKNSKESDVFWANVNEVLKIVNNELVNITKNKKVEQSIKETTKAETTTTKNDNNDIEAKKIELKNKIKDLEKVTLNDIALFFNGTDFYYDKNNKEIDPRGFSPMNDGNNSNGMIDNRIFYAKSYGRFHVYIYGKQPGKDGGRKNAAGIAINIVNDTVNNLAYKYFTGVVNNLLPEFNTEKKVLFPLSPLFNKRTGIENKFYEYIKFEINKYNEELKALAPSLKETTKEETTSIVSNDNGVTAKNDGVIELEQLPEIKEVEKTIKKKIDIKNKKYQLVDDSISYNKNEESLKKGIEYLKSRFPQIPIEVIEGFIEQDKQRALGVFASNLVKLSVYSDELTAYHESFHIGFTLFQTSQQQNEILDEASKKFGISRNSSQTNEKLLEDFKLGKEYYNNQSNDIRLEEKLAFEYQEWKQGRKNRTLGKKILDFFKDLYASIQSLITGKANILDLYNKIDKGYFSNANFITNPKSNINRLSIYDSLGNQLLNPVSANYIGGLVNFIINRSLSEGALFSKGITISNINSKIKEGVITVEQLYGNIKRNLLEYSQEELTGGAVEKLNDIKLILGDAENKGFFNTFIKWHLKNSPIGVFISKDDSIIDRLDSEELTIDALDFNDENIVDDDQRAEEVRNFERAGNEMSPYNSSSPLIKALLRLIPKAFIDNDGNIDTVTDAYGFPKMTDPINLSNRLALEFHDILDFNDFYNKLDDPKTWEKIPEVFYISQLLGFRKNNLIAVSFENANLITEFFKTYSKPKIDLIISDSKIIENEETDEKNIVNKTKPAGTSVFLKLAEKFQKGFVNAATNSEYHETGLNNANILKLEKYTDKDNNIRYKIKLPEKQVFDKKDNITAGGKENINLFFDILGIQLSDKTLEDIYTNESSRNIYLFIYNQLEGFSKLDKYQFKIKTNPINNVLFSKENTFKKLSGKIIDLIKLEEKYSTVYPQVVVRNAKGESQSIISESNEFTNYRYYINKSKNLEELYKHLPHLKNSLFETSYYRSMLFDTKGNRNAKYSFEIHNINGINITQNEYTNKYTTNSVEPGLKLLNDISMFYSSNVILEAQREAKSTHYSFFIKDNEAENQIEHGKKAHEQLTSSQKDKLSTFEDRMYNYLLKEIEIYKGKPINKELSLFGFLDKDFSYYTKENLDEFRKELKNKVNNSLKKLEDDLKLYVNDYLSYKIDGNELTKGFLNSFIESNILANIEYISIFAGNLQNYKDFAKRIAKSGSTGTILTSNPYLDLFFNNEKSINGFSLFGSKRKTGKSVHNTVIIADKIKKSSTIVKTIVDNILEINKRFRDKNYNSNKSKLEEQRKDLEKINTSDAQALINLDYYRELLINRGGIWNDYMQIAYEYEMLFLKDKLKGLSEQEQEKFERYEELISTSSDDIYTLPILKVQQSGFFEKNDLGNPTYHKMSLSPLLPSRDWNNDKMKKLIERSYQEDITYFAYESASKLKDNDIIKDFTKDNYTITPVLARDLKEQIKTSNDKEALVIFGSQFRKLLFSGFFDKGVPVSKSLSALYDNYKKALKDVLDYNKKQLQEDLGVILDENFNITVIDQSKFYERLQKQFDKDGSYNENVRNALQLDPNGKLLNPFEFTGTSNIVLNMLFGIIDNTIRVNNVKGGQYTLLSNAYYDELDFYKFNKETNKIAPAEVRVGLTGDFKKLLNLKDPKDETKTIKTLKRLNELLKNEDFVKANEKSLTIIGYRIPTQEQNSMEVLHIKEFMTPTSGFAIQMYDEITGKSGADFDIDKLFLISPTLDNNGNYISFEDTVTVGDKVYSIAKIPEAIKKLKTFQLGEKALNMLSVRKAYFKTLNENYKELKTNFEKKQSLTDSISILKNNIAIFKNEIEAIRLKRISENNRFETEEESLLLDDYEKAILEDELELNEKREEKAKLKGEIELNIENKNFNQDELLSVNETTLFYFSTVFQAKDSEIKEYINLLRVASLYGNHLQNKLTESLTDILTHPLQYEQLTKPNNSKSIKKLSLDNAKDLNILVELDEKGKVIVGRGWDIVDYITGTFRTYNLMNGGKKHLGVYAVANTIMSMLQLHTDAKIIPSYINKEGENITLIPLQSFFLEDEIKEEMYINNLYDTKGNVINDTFSELVTDTVDSPSDPSYQYAYITYKNIGVVTTLLMMGLPSSRVIDIINTGIIKRYNIYQEQGFTKNQAFDKIINSEAYKVLDENQELTPIELSENEMYYKLESDEKLNTFKKYQLPENQGRLNQVQKDEYKKKSLQLLNSYRLMEDRASYIREVTSTFNNDTTKIGSIVEAISKEFKKDELRNVVDKFIPTSLVDYFHSNSIISLFNNNKLISSITKELMPLFTDSVIINRFVGIVNATPLPKNLAKTFPNVLFQEYMKFIIQNMNTEFAIKGNNLRSVISDNPFESDISKTLLFKYNELMKTKGIEDLLENYDILNSIEFEDIVESPLDLRNRLGYPRDNKLSRRSFTVKMKQSDENQKDQENKTIQELNELLIYNDDSNPELSEKLNNFTKDLMALSFTLGGFSSSRFNITSLLPQNELIKEFKIAFENYDNLNTEVKRKMVDSFLILFKKYNPKYSNKKGYDYIGFKDYMIENLVNIAEQQLLEEKEKKTKNLPIFDTLPSKSIIPTMTYAGIGSRQTPTEVLSKMTEVSKYLESKGYTLNTGFTFLNKETGLDEEGADKAFSNGTDKKVLFGPYKIRTLVNGIINNNEYSEKLLTITDKIVEEIHPNPNKLSKGAKQLMSRNTHQIFGKDLNTPVDFVLFYAEETNDPLRPKGGTGQAVEMARRKSIPTINMNSENWRESLKTILNNSQSIALQTPKESKPISLQFTDIKPNIVDNNQNLQNSDLKTTLLNNALNKAIDNYLPDLDYYYLDLPSDLTREEQDNISFLLFDDGKSKQAKELEKKYVRSILNKEDIEKAKIAEKNYNWSIYNDEGDSSTKTLISELENRATTLIDDNVELEGLGFENLLNNFIKDKFDENFKQLAENKLKEYGLFKLVDYNPNQLSLFPNEEEGNDTPPSCA